MLNGLDLFSGIGGISIALQEWIRPIAYCEIDPYCQAVLLSRMSTQKLICAPIWDDIRSLDGRSMQGSVDIIYGGFPCQDISVAGRGKGLEGERSGLFFEIARVAKEIKPPFIFLENVPGICTRGGGKVALTLTQMGYDCRWCVISAASVGAPHLRERWFLLAYAKHLGSLSSEESGSTEESFRDSSERTNLSEQSKGTDSADPLASEFASHPESFRMHESRNKSRIEKGQSESLVSGVRNYWEENKPPICGVDDGIPYRAHRIGALGNAVVSQQAKKAFKILMGIK